MFTDEATIDDLEVMLSLVDELQNYLQHITDETTRKTLEYLHAELFETVRDGLGNIESDKHETEWR